MLQPLLTKLQAKQILIAAHRGASGSFTENTMEAFSKAVEHSADMIELDVQLTKDMQIVCYHDLSINGINIDELYFEQLKSHNIPLLNDVIATFHDKIYFVIELKQGCQPANNELGQNGKSHINDIIEKLAQLVVKHNLFGKVVFAAENLQYLEQIKDKLGKQVYCCAVLNSTTNKDRIIDLPAVDGVICSIAELSTNEQFFSQPCFTADINLLQEGNRWLVIGVYGVTTARDIATCRQYGVRFIGTDYPDKVHRLLL